MHSYYEYHHRAGYGSEDHMAGEVIARAARQLDIDTGTRIAQHVGLASHPVPMGGDTVRIPSARGVRRRMEAALRRAQREFRRRPDCDVSVVLVRTVIVPAGGVFGDTCYSRRMAVRQERRGTKWVSVASWEAIEDTE